MKEMQPKGWQNIQEEILRRINARVWQPGELIPNEVDLATEFGCARATVNRALRSLAVSGILDRKRKAGTRIATHPIRQATFSIPVLRLEIEATGACYRHSLLTRTLGCPPSDVAARLNVEVQTPLISISTVHLGDGKPYAYEERWINQHNVPHVEHADFETISANEWLVRNVPFEGGDIAFSAINASDQQAKMLDCEKGRALFVTDRTTWSKAGSITAVRLVFAPSHVLRADI